MFLGSEHLRLEKLPQNKPSLGVYVSHMKHHWA